MKQYLGAFILNFVFFLFITLLGVMCYANPNIFGSKSLGKYMNKFCKNPSNLENPICHNEFKKKKFILLLVDGGAFESVEFAFNPQKHNLSKVFINYETEFKVTGANFETMFTGKFSRNYKYRRFALDNFFFQLKEANYNLTYLGDVNPMFTFLGREKSPELNSYRISVEDVALSNICNDSYNIQDEWVQKFLRENSNEIGILQISKKQLYEKLDEYFKNSTFKKLNMTECLYREFDLKNVGEKFGLIYYTTVIDHETHKYTKNHYQTMAQVYSLDSYLDKFYEFINENPEFALIIASDHGGNTFSGDDELISHGYNYPGNEGIFIIYTKELNNKKKERNIENINRYHYASTMPMIIDGINIPLECTEMPLTLADSLFWEKTSVNMKIAQMNEYFNAASEIFPGMKKEFKKIIEKFNDIGKEDISYQEKKKKILNLQNKSFKIVERKSIPFFNYFFMFIFFVITFGKSFLEILRMKNILKEKDPNYNKRDFYINICGLFLPVLSFLFSIPYEVEDKIFFFDTINIVIMLILVIKSINLKKLGYFPIIVIIFTTLTNFGYHAEFFHELKSFLAHYYYRRYAEFLSFSIILLYIYLCLNSDLKNKYFDFNQKYPMFKISYIYCTTLACLIFLFHFTKPFYSTGPTSLFLNRLIYVLFVILFNLAMIIPKNEKGKKTKKFALTKIFIVLLQTFFIEDADTIFNLVIFIPLFEYFDYVFKKIKNNKSKIFLWQFNVLFFELFYILIKGTLDVKSHPNLPIREFKLNDKTIDTFLMVQIDVNYSIILLAFLFENTYFPKDKFINSKSMLMRYIIYIRANIVSSSFIYTIVIRKVDREVIKFMFFTAIYSLFVVFDFAYVMCFYGGCCGCHSLCKPLCKKYIGEENIVQIPENSVSVKESNEISEK